MMEDAMPNIERHRVTMLKIVCILSKTPQIEIETEINNIPMAMQPMIPKERAALTCDVKGAHPTEEILFHPPTEFVKP